MMNVIEVVNNWPAETFIQRHVQALGDEAGISVNVVARHGLTSYRDQASIDGQAGTSRASLMPNFNHLSWPGKLLGLRNLTSNSLFSKHAMSISERTLLGFFERLHPDLIHFHDATLAAYMCWIPGVLNIPYTLSLRGSDIQVFPLQSKDQHSLTVSAIGQAAGIHAVCDALGQQAVQLLGHSLAYSVIYTTVPLPPALPGRENVPVDGAIHLVSSGRFMWRKGFDDLLTAVGRLRGTGLNVKLTLVGTGPDLDCLLYLRSALGLEEVVNLPGKLNYVQILELLQSAHAYIQSSVVEGLSNSLVEAMANGLPVFATDVGGTREVVHDGVTGFLLSPSSPREWVEKLMLVQDQTLMDRVRSSGYEKAAVLCSAPGHAQKFSAFYDAAMKS
jgi:colanic acid/amylovoran biosynthesis glycosyltransferase